MIDSAGSKGVKTMMEGFGEIMTLEENVKYLRLGKSTFYRMARKGKTPSVKIKPGKNNKVIIRIPYEQKLIKKETVHSLKHSFVTYLLEKWGYLKYIQEILGHKSSKTTEIYIHVSKKNLSAIKNPHDSLLAGGGP